jgi:hypothetical protein
MKHPQIGTHQPAASSGIPWSPEGEARARREIRQAWIAMWVGLFGGGMCMVIAIILRNLAPMAGGLLFWFLFVVRLYQLSLLRAELGEEMRRLPNGDFFEGSGMLANKPRSTSNLTQWTQWRPDSTGFLCTCRQLHQWTEAEWIPNLQVEDTVIGTQVEINDALGAFVDPHGGRFVILCPCGLGHYKLKA